MLGLWASSAGAVRSMRLLPRHHALHQPGDDREDRAAGTAADDLTDERPDIEAAAAGCGLDRRNKGLQQLPASDAADRTGDGVADTAEIVVLQCRPGGVATDHSRDELNDQIDDSFHDSSLSLAERRSCSGPSLSSRAAPLPRRHYAPICRDLCVATCLDRSCDQSRAGSAIVRMLALVRIDAPRGACSMGANRCCAEGVRAAHHKSVKRNNERS